MEGGKNFPALALGPFPAPFQTDSSSVAAPADGFILSGSKRDIRDCVNFANDEMGKKLNRTFLWPVINVKPGQTLKVTWEYTAVHVTRGYRWLGSDTAHHSRTT